MKKILFVDDDLDFSKLILAVSKSFSTDIHHVQTVKDAVIALKKVKFDAYIIDGKLPDNPGLAIVKLIRKKLDKKNPIAFVSGYYRDTKSFTKIHEELQVDYVVNKPLSTEKMKKLLAMLLNIQDDSSEFDDEFLIELKKNYSKSIYIKLSRIEANINNFVSNPSSETQNDFRTEIHKIAGGAATYGFPKVTELCKNMETLIEQNIDFDPLTVLKNINIHSFFHKLKQEFILPEYNLDDHQQIEEISGNSIVQERLFFHSEDRYKVLYIKITDIIDDVDLVDKKIRSYFSKANIMIKMDTTSYLILMSLEKNPEAKQYLIKNLQQIGRNLPKNGKLLFTISSYPETGNGLFSLLTYSSKYLKQLPTNKVVKTNKSSKKSIFLVDDDHNLVDMLIFAFENRNSKVTVAYSGEEAISKIKKMNKDNYPDLIILDRQMPDMDGIKLFDYFDEYTLENIPIIFLSSKSSHDEILRGLRAGAVEYLSKPFNLDILLEKSSYLINK